MLKLFKTTRGRVEDLESEVIRLQTEVKALRQEWEDFYDKAMRRMERHRKREALDQGNNAVTIPPAGEPQYLPPAILARRRNGHA